MINCAGTLCSDVAVVHTWWVDLEATPGQTVAWEGLLSPDEVARAAQLRYRRDRDRFIAGRAQLRILLGSLLDEEPERVVFAYGPSGKPYLDGATLQFNVAHTEGAGLVAVTEGLRVGADVERVRREPVLDGVARRFFSPGEARRLCAVDEPERTVAFFRCWTRKEAFVKATGVGVAAMLGDFEVSFGEGQPPAVVWCASGLGAASQWSVVDVTRDPDRIAAVVVESPRVGVVSHGELAVDRTLPVYNRKSEA